MKKWIAALLAVLVALFPARAVSGGEIESETGGYGQIDGLGAKAYCLIERESGRILYAYNENERLPMASTTKIMTALLAIEQCGMDERVTAGPNASGVPGTSLYLQKGETLSMRQMLLGLMLRSGNDAAVAIAEHIDGDTAAFAARMNERAKQLDADANFVTPNGLDADDHGASALAMARIAAQALKNDTFRQIVSTKTATLPWEGSEYERVLTNKNRLLTQYEGATGVKTGYTSKAGRCLVFSAMRGGMELVGCVLGCYTWFDSAEKLLDAGFEQFDLAQAIGEGETVGQIKVTGGKKESAPLIAGGLSAPVGQHEAWEVRMDLPKSIAAPVKKGDKIGTAEFVLHDTGTVLARCDILAGEDIGENTLSNAARDVIRRWLLLSK